MDLTALATFPEGTLWCGGVHLQNRTSITAYLHLYIGRDRAPVADSSVDFLPFEIERGKIHAKRTVRRLTAFVLFCNSKTLIIGPDVTDQDDSPPASLVI